MSLSPADTVNTVWTTDSTHQPRPALAGDMVADVVIIGAGITGLSAAMSLASEGRKVVLLEADTVGSGTTGSSTGNLYVPVDSYLQTLRSKHDDDVLTAVAEARNFAIARVLQWIDSHQIDCDLQRVAWYLFTTRAESTMDRTIVDEFHAARHVGLPVSNAVPDDFPYDEVSALTAIAAQAQINPLKYVRGLARALGDRVQVFEHSRVTSVDDGEPCTVHTDQGTITAHEVIMATHTPKGIYSMHAEMEAKREYVITAKLRKKYPPAGIYWHLTESQHFSVRPYSNSAGDFLLVLGGSHVVGNKRDNEEKLSIVENYLRQHFDVESIVYRWGAQNYSAADGLPYIGNSPMQKHVHIATGFAADGLVYGTLAGFLISESICGRENAWTELFSPRRFKPGAAAPGIARENLNVARHLLKDYLFYKDAEELSEVLPGEGRTLKLNGEKIAAHRDATGALHVVSAVCPHMGCLVHWNNAESSWDCPCHGSRFAIDGEVLEGPAFHGLAKPGS